MEPSSQLLQALKDHETAYQKLINRMPDGVYKTTHDGRVVDVNPAMVRILGYDSKEELMGVNIAEELYFDPEDREIKTIENLTNDLISYRLRKKDGTEVWVEDNGWYTYDNQGNILYHEGVIRDVTEKKRILNDLTEAKNRAEESDRLKTAFLMNMSHEIRTPMNGILGFLDLLNNENLSTEDRKKFMDIMNRSAERLLNTINNIIEISKIDSGVLKRNCSGVNLNNLIQDQIDFFSPLARKNGLSLISNLPSGSEPVMVYSDANLIEGILTNLIGNAIKFTDIGYIEIGCFPQTHKITLYVKDTGIGIPESYQTRIFERFVQTEISQQRSKGGTGLGLAICSGYAKVLGAELHLKSAPGEGSTFSFNLNAKPD